MVEIVTAAGIIKVGAAAGAQRAGCLLKKILQVIGLRVSHQAESIKNQNNIFKAHEEKYQSRINALETLAAGATEENKICDLVAVARFLNATLIIPEIQESTRSKGIRLLPGSNFTKAKAIKGYRINYYKWWGSAGLLYLSWT
ncbi:uncharacterized protein DS421_3g65900 [Arachis hypogaea]|nr:uncharacterized protein DS421_3g65900 [Arachis hypogaea]